MPRVGRKTDIIGAVREIHADNIETGCRGGLVCGSAQGVVGEAGTSAKEVDLLHGVRFRTCEEWSVSDRGFWARQRTIGPTDGANDGGATVVLGGNHLRVELGVPLQLHPVAEMVEGRADGHCAGSERKAIKQEEVSEVEKKRGEEMEEGREEDWSESGRRGFFFAGGREKCCCWRSGSGLG